MRQKIVGSRLGLALLEYRRWKSLRSVPLDNPESACAIANDIVADRLISQICISGGTFVDIGAHIGSVLSSVHRHDGTINIIAIEADPRKIASLKRNFAYCEFFEFAVGEREGTADFYVNCKKSGFSSLVAAQTGAQQKLSVRLSTLDTLLADTSVDVIKVDIEGAELGALKGGVNIIQRDRPIIMFESVGTGRNALGYSADLLWEWFDTLDFMIFTPDRVAHDAPPLTLEAFIDNHQYPFRTHNYFAIPKEKRTAARDKAREILSVATA